MVGGVSEVLMSVLGCRTSVAGQGEMFLPWRDVLALERCSCPEFVITKNRLTNDHDYLS